MQFKVPQFLDIEDKIFGPFTFSQAVYLAGGAGLSYTLYKWLGFVVAAIPILLVVAFSLAMAFYKPNGKPFVDLIQAAFKYAFQYRLYIWKRRMVKKSELEKQQDKAEQEQLELMFENRAKLSGSKLRDLAWSLDILDLKKEEE